MQDSQNLCRLKGRFLFTKIEEGGKYECQILVQIFKPY